MKKLWTFIKNFFKTEEDPILKEQLRVEKEIKNQLIDLLLSKIQPTKEGEIIWETFKHSDDPYGDDGILYYKIKDDPTSLYFAAYSYNLLGIFYYKVIISVNGSQRRYEDSVTYKKIEVLVKTIKLQELNVELKTLTEIK